MAEENNVAAPSTIKQLLTWLTWVRDYFTALSPATRRSMVLSIILLFGVAATIIWFADRTDWRVLYSGMEARDAATIEQELGSAGIMFRTTADQSGVEVPAELLDKARMEVASKGMPQTGRLGFELFDKPNWVGSEFDEKVNYQRALEGELEHTVGSLGEVKQARVHLVLPQSSLFSEETKAAKASVVLKLRRGALSREQVDSIRRLVAGAVADLALEDVVLVDADGRQNFSLRERYMDEQDASRELEQRLIAMLEPLAGASNVRAVVNVTYDKGSEERTDEVYDPSQTGTLSLEKRQETSGSAARAPGIPGTASNTPGAVPAASVQAPAPAADGGTPPLLKPLPDKQSLPVYPQGSSGQNVVEVQENGTYAVTRHLMHRQEGPGRVRRLTAAIVVNDRLTSEGEGKLAHAVWKPRSSEELHHLEDLAQAALGYDLRRGDSITVQNISFGTNEVERSPQKRWFVTAADLISHNEYPALRSTLTNVVLGSLLVFAVLRPLGDQLVKTMRQPVLPIPQQGVLDARNEKSLGLEVPVNARLEAAREEEEAVLENKVVSEKVREYIRQKPMESTRLLETWISQRNDS